MRILIGPVEVAGVAKGLSKGLAELGVTTQLVLSIKHPFAYGGEKKGFLLAVWQLLGQWRAAPNQPFWRKALAVVLHRAWGFLVLCWALFAFDAFIFLYGQTLTDTGLELVILRRLGKKIVFINVGSDFRPPYMDGSVSPPTDAAPDVSHIAQLARRAKRKIVLHEKFADFIVSSPSSAHFHERPFINWFSMGVPASFDFQPLPETEERGCLRVVHSPSNPVAKGSQIICEVIQQLIDEGVPLELVRLQGVSNDEVLRQLQRCDFVVDQLYSDIPMAVLGSEAARLAKPCIVAGYLAGEVGAYIPQQDVPPSLYVRPEQLREAIERLVEDAEFRRDLGMRAREFVSQRWACKAVAERYLMLLNGQARSEWWFDPATIAYVGGCGMPLAHVASLLALLIETCGTQSLQVSDKPRLEQALIELAQQAERKRTDA
jgi:glycosyltransferase involved in cell wall biosynthesis